MNEPFDHLKELLRVSDPLRRSISIEIFSFAKELFVLLFLDDKQEGNSNGMFPEDWNKDQLC
jgi:hypothetical protein